MASNYLEVTDMMALEGLRQLTNPLEILPFFNTEYNAEFTTEMPIGDTLRIPFPKQFIASQDNTLAYTPQPIQSRHASVTIDQVSKVHFEWDSIELALRMPRGEERIKRDIVKPAMTTIRNDMESRAALYAVLNTPNVVGILGTNPATFDAVYGAAGQRLAEIGSPDGDKGAFLTPGVARALRATAVSQFNPPDAISKMWKKGIIGEVNGIDTYSSNSLRSRTTGAWAGVVEIATAPTSAGLVQPIPETSTLSLTQTNGDTFKKGDAVSIAGVFDVNPITYQSTGTLKSFVITADVTTAGTAASIVVKPPVIGPGSPYQNVSALPVAGADLALMPGTNASGVAAAAKSGFEGLVLGHNAFAQVHVKLANPPSGGGTLSSYARDPETGISVSVLRWFDGNLRKWCNRIECVYGFGCLYNERDAVRIEGA
jgi:P22 coat protein - gene protein 5